MFDRLSLPLRPPAPRLRALVGSKRVPLQQSPHLLALRRMQPERLAQALQTWLRQGDSTTP